jgi:sulfur-oxidizing protein SoxX
MPAYGNVENLNRVGSAWRGRPILTPAQIDDVVAFLSTLHAK